MPRRCPSCGEPGHNVATFCGRCGALSGREREPRAVRRPEDAPEPRRPLAALRRIGLRQAVASAATLAVLAVLVSGLEVDDAQGEVTVPAAASADRSPPSTAADGPADRPTPAPPPELAPCEGDAAASLCARWRQPRRHDQLVLADSRTVHLGGPDGGIVALDRGTGAVQWATAHEVGVVTEAAVGSEGLVVATAAGTPAVLGIEPRDGSVRWSRTATTTVELRRDAGPGLLFEPDRLRSIDPVTGADRWSWRTDDPAGVHLVPGTGSAPVVTSDNLLASLDPMLGTVRWELRLPSLRGVVPAGEGRLVAVDGDGGLAGLDAGTGAVRWRSRLAFGDRSGVRLWGAEGIVVVVIDPPLADDGTRTPRIVGVDPTSGEVRWVHLYRTAVERRGVSLGPGTAILVGTTSPGTIAALDLGTGGIAWQRDLGDEPAHARVVDGMVLAASGRDVWLLSATDGSVEEIARIPSPVLGIVDAVPGSTVLRTSTEVVAVTLPTGG